VDPAPRPLPLFPLPTVVLFPRIRVPLHVFEPRYRQLTREVLEGERRIGMVAVRPEHVHEMAGDPPVYAVGCAGRIAESRRLADGRYLLVLEGSHRFRIVAEGERPEGRLYRVAETVALADALPPEDLPHVVALRAKLTELVHQLVDEAEDGTGETGKTPFPPASLRGSDDATFVNALAHAFPLAPREKQGLLEADTIAERGERLLGAVRFHLAARAAGGAPDPGVLH